MPDPEDDRGLIIKLTAQGAKVKTELPCVEEEAMEKVSEKFDASRLSEMREDLKKLTQNLS